MGLVRDHGVEGGQVGRVGRRHDDSKQPPDDHHTPSCQGPRAVVGAWGAMRRSDRVGFPQF